MSVVLEIRRRGRHVAGSILGALLFAYFILHAIQGDRGLLAWVQLRQQIVVAESGLNVSEVNRNSWENRAALLAKGWVDPDMLDERVRIVTGFGHPDEIVIPYRGR
ncbi:MAG: septum formation initiator family protein [Rhodospirillaceae bacterium]|jgi:cell division protein FtsB|nr:septum formation initiator family protein [Rhodospirillaceae bacterium]